MNLGELIKAYRDEARDDAEPFFCSDVQLKRYANEAQVEAARRAFLLADSTTSAICSVNYAAEAQTITLDARVLEVRAARIGAEPVAVVKKGDMDCYWPSWQVDTLRALPHRLVAGVDSGKLHLYPRPATGGTVQLEVYRLPLAPMAGNDDVPEIRAECHQSLVDWMLWRAFSRQDSDLLDPQRAATALARFEAEFGKGHGARNEEWSRFATVSHPEPIA